MQTTRIQTHDNKCFVTRDMTVPDAPKKSAKKKPEKVNLKFGKIRLSVTNAKRVRVSQDGNAMVVILEE